MGGFKLHKGITEKKKLSQKRVRPAYVNVASHKTLSHLEVHGFISLQFETIMLTNSRGSGTTRRLTFLKPVSIIKKSTLPNTVEQMDPDQGPGEAECSKY